MSQEMRDANFKVAWIRFIERVSEGQIRPDVFMNYIELVRSVRATVLMC